MSKTYEWPELNFRPEDSMVEYTIVSRDGTRRKGRRYSMYAGRAARRKRADAEEERLRLSRHAGIPVMELEFCAMLSGRISRCVWKVHKVLEHWKSGKEGRLRQLGVIVTALFGVIEQIADSAAIRLAGCRSGGERSGHQGSTISLLRIRLVPHTETDLRPYKDLHDRIAGLVTRAADLNDDLLRYPDETDESLLEDIDSVCEDIKCMKSAWHDAVSRTCCPDADDEKRRDNFVRCAPVYIKKLIEARESAQNAVSGSDVRGALEVFKELGEASADALETLLALGGTDAYHTEACFYRQIEDMKSAACQLLFRIRERMSAVRSNAPAEEYGKVDSDLLRQYWRVRGMCANRNKEFRFRMQYPENTQERMIKFIRRRQADMYGLLCDAVCQAADLLDSCGT